MKEFEKYWEVIKGKNDFSIEKHYAKEAWEAALEWMNKECEKADNSACLDCSCFSHIADIIEEELEKERTL